MAEYPFPRYDAVGLPYEAAVDALLATRDTPRIIGQALVFREHVSGYDAAYAEVMSREEGYLGDGDRIVGSVYDEEDYR